MPTCTACLCGVDYLRSCYKSRFYYGKGPDDFIVGKYVRAPLGAEVVSQPNLYASHVWLDPWERSTGPGDTDIGVQWTNGFTAVTTARIRNDEVAPLRRGCRPLSEGVFLGYESYMGIPLACYKSPPVIRHGNWGYRLSFPGLQFDLGTGVVDFTYEPEPAWDGDHWEWGGGGIPYVLTMTPIGEYPSGQGFTIVLRWPDTGPAVATLTWVLSLGTFQGDTDSSEVPTAGGTMTLVAFTNTLIKYLETGFPDELTNPYDIYP